MNIQQAIIVLKAGRKVKNSFGDVYSIVKSEHGLFEYTINYADCNCNHTPLFFNKFSVSEIFDEYEIYVDNTVKTGEKVNIEIDGNWLECSVVKSSTNGFDNKFTFLIGQFEGFDEPMKLYGFYITDSDVDCVDINGFLQFKDQKPLKVFKKVMENE
jgi:hypothetical protein